MDHGAKHGADQTHDRMLILYVQWVLSARAGECRVMSTAVCMSSELRRLGSWVSLFKQPGRHDVAGACGVSSCVAGPRCRLRRWVSFWGLVI